jgi:hypothetical protein
MIADEIRGRRLPQNAPRLQPGYKVGFSGVAMVKPGVPLVAQWLTSLWPIRPTRLQALALNIGSSLKTTADAELHTECSRQGQRQQQGIEQGAGR